MRILKLVRKEKKLECYKVITIPTLSLKLGKENKDVCNIQAAVSILKHQGLISMRQN
jgi:hypothetical protein